MNELHKILTRDTTRHCVIFHYGHRITNGVLWSLPPLLYQPVNQMKLCLAGRAINCELWRTLQILFKFVWNHVYMDLILSLYKCFVAEGNTILKRQKAYQWFVQFHNTYLYTVQHIFSNLRVFSSLVYISLHFTVLQSDAKFWKKCKTLIVRVIHHRFFINPISYTVCTKDVPSQPWSLCLN